MPNPKITPCLWIEKDAKKAVRYYQSVFKKGKLISYKAYKNAGNPGGNFDVAEMEVLGMRFQILAAGPFFKFNEAISFSIRCKDQAEVDYYWEKLSAVPESEQCGWCKDKFGLSWQIVPENMAELMKKPDAFKTMMNQHKIVIAEY